MTIRMRRVAAAGALALLLGATIVTAASAQASGTAQVQSHGHSHSAGGSTARDQVGLAVVRAATAAYHDLRIAQAKGYTILADTAGKTCIDQPGVGGMGVHYVDGDLVGDPAINAWHPEAVVYAPTTNGRLRLAAAEYVVIKSAWDAGHAAPPSLFGHEFMVTEAPNRYGLPAFYSLHAWAWDDNPAGPFEMWNPDVVCP